MRRKISIFLLKQILFNISPPTPPLFPFPSEIAASHQGAFGKLPWLLKVRPSQQALGRWWLPGATILESLGASPASSWDHCCQQPQDAGLLALSFPQLHQEPKAIVSRRPTGQMCTQFLIFSLETLCPGCAKTSHKPDLNPTRPLLGNTTL